MGGGDATESRQDSVSHLPGALRVEPLAPRHAGAAARLHIAGQPDTFLTSLGPDVLEAVYAVLPDSSAGFGFAAALADASGGPDVIIGFVSATTSVSRLFADAGLRHACRLLPPLLSRFARRPALIGRSLQTVLYPLIVRDQHGERDETAAELLSIMVEQDWRGRGIGAMLLETLVAECAARGVTRLDVTVDADNHGAQRFYDRHGFRLQKSFRLYGREMRQFSRSV